MKLKGRDNAAIPSALVDRLAEHLKWNPEELDEWLHQNPDS